MFESIIQHFIARGELHERAADSARSFAAWLENQSAYTTQRLREVIQQFNFESLQAAHPDKKGVPWMEFFRGVDDFGSSLGIGHEGDVDILTDQEPIVKRQYNHTTEFSNEERIAAQKARTSVKINLQQYPISLLGYYDYKFSETAMFYTWLAYLWQEVEGHQCGMIVCTVQNNSVARFFLNDFLDDDFSAFMDHNDTTKPVRIGKFFPRKLSVVELFMRANLTGYPCNPYRNYWRYFEKGDAFTEVVTYECATGIRSGKLSERHTAEVTQVSQHANPKSALLYVTDFTNQAIFNGWEEKFRPAGMPAMMHANAFDFEFWTGVAWYSGDEKTNRLDARDILTFESEFGIELPDVYFQYLRLFNGRQYNKYFMYFPVDDLYTVNVEKFYTLEELKKSAAGWLPEKPEFLWIGVLNEGSYLGLCVKHESSNYGRIVLGKGGSVKVCDYTFKKFAAYAQSSPVQPEIFAAQENDVVFLKKRLDEGWDFNTEYRYNDAIGQAAEHNAHDALELLLRSGARLRHRNHRQMPWTYDEKTMDLLDRFV